jgi:uroporphyrinogen decarboxylase
MATLTSRERVLRALHFQEPDRVPIDLGGGLCSISYVAYGRLLAHLGWQEEIVIGGMLTQVVRLSERMLQRLGSDVGHIFAGPPDVSRGRDLEGAAGEENHTFTDEWGGVWRKCGYYYEMVDSPLKHASTLADLEAYPWPDPCDQGRFRRLADDARQIREQRQAAVTLDPLAGGILEMASSLRGHQNFYTDLALNPEFAAALLDGITDFFVAYYRQAMRVAGQYIDVVFFGDDYGTQKSLVISPASWREMIKPRLARMIRAIKEEADVLFQLHSDGNLRPILDDLIEIGVDVLDPIQPSATDMNPGDVRRLVGQRLAFHGAIDQQGALRHGTPQDVADEVRTRLRDLGPGGGYVLAVSPNIQADVPPENILALYDTALELGRYPIQC